MVVINAILFILWAFLAWNTAYFLWFALLGRIKKLKAPDFTEPNLRFAVYIACYKGDEVILHTAPKALEQNYPKELFDVYVIADKLKKETIEKLSTTAAKIIEVEFEKSTKAKSLKAAVERTKKDYDYAVILDIDNIMEPDFLQKMNNRLQAGTEILQAHRVALNTDTPFAILDAISEEVNNHIFRYGHRVGKLSAAFIGSGKALKFDFYKTFIHEIEAVGGFDKEMELKLLAKGYTIEYAPEALVYDEKVQEASRFENQRKRWLSAQFHYFQEHFLKALIAFFTKGNADYLDKALQMILVPRVIQLGVVSFIGVINLFFSLFPGSLFWILIWLLTSFAILISIPKSFYSIKTLGAVMHLPKAFMLMFLNLFKLKGANKTFIHTEHSASAHKKDEK